MPLQWSLPACFSCASKTHHLEFGHAWCLPIVFHFHGLTATKKQQQGSWFLRFFLASSHEDFSKSPSVTLTAVPTYLSSIILHVCIK